VVPFAGSLVTPASGSQLKEMYQLAMSDFDYSCDAGAAPSRLLPHQAHMYIIAADHASKAQRNWNSPDVPRGFLCWWNVGAGKTYLISSIIHAYISYGPSVPIYVVTSHTNRDRDNSLYSEIIRGMSLFVEGGDAAARALFKEPNVMSFEQFHNLAVRSAGNSVRSLDGQPALLVMDEFHEISSPNVMANKANVHALKLKPLLLSVRASQWRIYALSATPGRTAEELFQMWNILGVRPVLPTVLHGDFRSLESHFRGAVAGRVHYFNNGADTRIFPARQDIIVSVGMTKIQKAVYDFYSMQYRQANGGPTSETWENNMRKACNIAWFKDQHASAFAPKSRTSPFTNPYGTSEALVYMSPPGGAGAQPLSMLVGGQRGVGGGAVGNQQANARVTTVQQSSGAAAKFNEVVELLMQDVARGLERLAEISPKMARILQSIHSFPTMKHMVYSTFVEGGIQPLELLLRAMQFQQLRPVDMLPSNYRELEPGRRFISSAEWKTNSTREFNDAQKALLQTFNHDYNVDGSHVAVILLHGAYNTGLNLHDVRFAYILETQRNVADEIQAVGRVTRFKSHCRLSPENRNVVVYHFICNQYEDGSGAAQSAYTSQYQSIQQQEASIRTMQAELERLNAAGRMQSANEIARVRARQFGVPLAGGADIDAPRFGEEPDAVLRVRPFVEAQLRSRGALEGGGGFEDAAAAAPPGVTQLPLLENAAQSNPMLQRYLDAEDLSRQYMARPIEGSAMSPTFDAAHVTDPLFRSYVLGQGSDRDARRRIEYALPVPNSGVGNQTQTLPSNAEFLDDSAQQNWNAAQFVQDIYNANTRLAETDAKYLQTPYPLGQLTQPGGLAHQGVPAGFSMYAQPRVPLYPTMGPPGQWGGPMGQWGGPMGQWGGPMGQWGGPMGQWGGPMSPGASMQMGHDGSFAANPWLQQQQLFQTPNYTRTQMEGSIPGESLSTRIETLRQSIAEATRRYRDSQVQLARIHKLTAKDDNMFVDVKIRNEARAIYEKLELFLRVMKTESLYCQSVQKYHESIGNKVGACSPSAQAFNQTLLSEYQRQLQPGAASASQSSLWLPAFTGPQGPAAGPGPGVPAAGPWPGVPAAGPGPGVPAVSPSSSGWLGYSLPESVGNLFRYGYDKLMGSTA